jgi:hypothetical protein
MTKNQNRYILVFTDHFTKWTETFALKRADEKEIAKCFVQGIVLRHGSPEQLLTDRGKAFNGRMIKEIADELQVTKINTSGYRPQTNGLTERFNKTLATMLSMYVSGHQRDWDTLLPYVTFAYRNTQQASTGETPFYLMYLRDARVPGDKNLSEVESFVDTDKYKAEMVQRMATIQQEVAKWNDLIRVKRENKAKRDWTIDQFKEGELVWLFSYRKRRGLTRKLMMAWHGPYRILRIVPPMNVELQDRSGRTFKQLIHISRIKKCHNGSRPKDYIDGEPYPENLEPPMEPDPEEQEVEDVVSHRRKGKRMEYQIKWKDGDSTWEPEENLKHCRELLDRYQRRQSIDSGSDRTRNGKRRQKKRAGTGCTPGLLD